MPLGAVTNTNPCKTVYNTEISLNSYFQFEKWKPIGIQSPMIFRVCTKAFMGLNSVEL